MPKYKSPEMVWTSQDLSHEWRRFYRQASCILDGLLHDKEENVKVSYLKMWVGDKGLDVFEGFQFAKPEHAAKLAVVVKKYKEYCSLRKNHIMAALKFNERQQAEGESFDSFVTDLKILVKDCGYQEEERIVCDAIVFRCKHSKVREKCLDWADELTLEKAVKIGRTHEMNLDSLKKLAKDEDPTVNIVEKRQTQSCHKHSKQDAEKQASEEKEKRIAQKVSVGTIKPTENAQQWANNAVSTKRGIIILSSVDQDKCITYGKKMIHKIDRGDESTLFMYAVESNSLAEDEQFHKTVELEGTQVKFQLDTDAKANVISLKTYSSLTCRPLPPLRKTRTVLVSFSAQAET